MKAIIIDDEIDAIENLKSMLQLFDQEVDIIDIAQSVESGISKIEKLKPDLIFLDIEMPNGNGFSLLEKVKFKSFQTIFVTAYSQFAIKALRMNALDYLLKPIDPDDLIRAIAVAKQNIKSKVYPVHDELVQGNKKANFEKLGIPTNSGIRYVPLENIIRFQANSNYTNIFIKGEKPTLISKTLKLFEKILVDQNFIRVHQSHMVNLNHVKEFNRADGSYLLLNNGDKVSVSKSNRTHIRNILKSI